jgi:hypothetical protein
MVTVKSLPEQEGRVAAINGLGTRSTNMNMSIHCCLAHIATRLCACVGQP